MEDVKRKRKKIKQIPKTEEGWSVFCWKISYKQQNYWRQESSKYMKVDKLIHFVLIWPSLEYHTLTKWARTLNPTLEQLREYIKSHLLLVQLSKELTLWSCFLLLFNQQALIIFSTWTWWIRDFQIQFSFNYLLCCYWNINKNYFRAEKLQQHIFKLIAEKIFAIFEIFSGIGSAIQLNSLFFNFSFSGARI